MVSGAPTTPSRTRSSSSSTCLGFTFSVRLGRGWEVGGWVRVRMGVL